MKFGYLFLCSSILLLKLFQTFVSGIECDQDSENGFCEIKSDDFQHEKYKYSQASNNKWSSYLKLINDSKTSYTPCVHSDKDCTCHENLINVDLNTWANDGITKDLMEKTKRYGTHYQIINHVLYRSEDCMFPARCSGVEHFILEIIKELPNMEFVLNSRDYPQSSKFHNPLPVFSFSKTKDYVDIMYPAWTFWEGGPAISLYPTGLGRWDKHRISITKAAKKWPWNEKITKAFFRGSRTSTERDPLILLSRDEPSLVDAQYTKNQAWRSEKDTLGMLPASEISLEDHCQFKYLFNFRGVAASFRFKHLFLCKSLVLHVGNEWNEFFYFSMKPWIHYIPVNRDLADARNLLEFLKENEEIAQEIAYNGYEYIWQHLKMEDVTCYWKKLLTKYAELFRYKIVRNKNLKKVL